jgi:hypothetical protein
MTGSVDLPSFQHFNTSAHDWSAEVILLAKGNTATVCLFTGPDPALRERFDGTAECTQEGHSLYGKTPDAETTRSFNRLRKECRNGQLIFTSAIRLSLDDSALYKASFRTQKPCFGLRKRPTTSNALLKRVDKSCGRNNASSASSYLEQLHTLALVTSETVDQFVGRVLKLLQALEIRADSATA